MREGKESNKVSDEEFTMLYERALRRMRERERMKERMRVLKREKDKETEKAKIN